MGSLVFTSIRWRPEQRHCRRPSSRHSAWAFLMACPFLIASLFLASKSQAQTPSNTYTIAPGFQSTHVASVPLSAQKILLSVPLKVANEDADVAIEELRERRLAVEQAAASMGCDASSVHSALVTVGKPNQRSMVIRGNATPEALMYQATCTVFALATLDFVDGDPEDLVLEAQEKLQQLTSVLPENDGSSTNSRTQTYYSGNELVHPTEAMFLFAASVSPQQRKEAFANAVVKAKEQAGVLSEAIGTEIGDNLRITIMPSYTTISRPGSTSPTRIVMTRYPDLVFGRHPGSLVYEARLMISSAK